MTTNTAEHMLEVRDLRVHFATDGGVVKAVDGVDWYVDKGETLAIVGESGSGKSVSAMSLMGLVPAPPATFPSGEVLLEGRSLLTMPEAEQRKLRGKDIAMIFQDPLTALNPVYKVGDQIAEMIRAHDRQAGRATARRRAVDLLGEVGIPNPATRAVQYPHEFSGGMRQRAMIAMALANDPKVLLADEPTTALDVTVQAQIMGLLEKLQDQRETAIVLITHDLGLVAAHADRIMVMYAGKVVETGTNDEIFAEPRHAYTYGLLSSLARMDQSRPEKLEPIPGQPPNLAHVPSGCAFHPRCRFATAACTEKVPELVRVTDRPGHRHACLHHEQVADAVATPREPAVHVGDVPAPQAATGEPMLRTDGLTKRFPIRSGVLIQRTVGVVQAVDGIDLEIPQGQTLSLVGESGCGKSTAARAILRLHEPTSGTVHVNGRDVTALAPQALRAAREDMQIVFQDPYASLNPRMTVRSILSEKYELLGGELTENTIAELLETVGLSAEYAQRYPHEFSGGQRQRVGIARAIALNPKFVVLDEPVSALDVSIQAQVLNLLEQLQRDFGLTYLFIAHDLSVVRHISDRVAVMYLGNVVEVADRDDLFDRPQHPYTQALISAVPIPDPRVERERERIVLTGDVPNPADPPSGCRFRTRCWKHLELPDSDKQRCIDEQPLLQIGSGPSHRVACHFAEEREVLRS
ncbi:ABC transporter ATP-binding protein [Pseudonocardia parietis]|uniref:Peptide/nickel transport system ATP-binding protein n=1 Tax=Pseudonocardia parietis TaxID=570936 RepID=A0ABS4W4K1_9PSEU|nr:ABC transporter ATP-binding protein [Pseudonocardia parietis]MBP2370838.1 peptide/nickel transport system ATP-binding protein [Pseudonocardia parietis]